MSGQDPVAWLRAQVEARLLLAREAGGGQWQTGCTCEGDCPGYPSCERVEGDDITIYSEGGHDAMQAEHIAANDPQDTIARCEAELAILDLYEKQAAKAGENAMEEDRTWTLEPVVALLASGYRHRPGFPAAFAA